jgi:hypothetical protein
MKLVYYLFLASRLIDICHGGILSSFMSKLIPFLNPLKLSNQTTSIDSNSSLIIENLVYENRIFRDEIFYLKKSLSVQKLASLKTKKELVSLQKQLNQQSIFHASEKLAIKRDLLNQLSMEREAIENSLKEQFNQTLSLAKSKLETKHQESLKLLHQQHSIELQKKNQQALDSARVLEDKLSEKVSEYFSC